VVGPVDARAGIAGIAAKGMTRNEVIHVLGPPLEPRETTAEWEAKPYSMDPVLSDYFSGIYADAHWFGMTVWQICHSTSTSSPSDSEESSKCTW